MIKEMKLTVPQGKTVLEAAVTKLFHEMVNNRQLSATCTIEYDDGTEIVITLDIHLK